MSVIRDNTQHHKPAKRAKRPNLVIEYIASLGFAVAFAVLILYALGALW